MVAVHVVLPEFAGFPDFVEEEDGGVFIVLVKVVLNAAGFRESGGNEASEACFDAIDLIGFGFDLCDDDERWFHGRGFNKC